MTTPAPAPAPAPTPSATKQLDDYGFFGPQYSYVDNIPIPAQIGVRQEPSFSAIIDSLGGVNYYMDTIGFGGRTLFDQQNPQPMGTRYYLNTGMRCSNGATMSEYVDGITKGDLLGDRVAAALQASGLPGLRGLAPGMLENARDALDPRPILAAVTATGYPVCQQVRCPVGDGYGRIQNPDDKQPYIVDSVEYVNGLPTQTRWVQAYDRTDSAIQVTRNEFAAAPKCYSADGTYMENPPTGCPSVEPAVAEQPGDGRFRLCTVVRGASLPPTLASGSDSEGFKDLADEATAVALAVGAAVIGATALWWFARHKSS